MFRKRTQSYSMKCISFGLKGSTKPQDNKKGTGDIIRELEASGNKVDTVTKNTSTPDS